MATRRRTPSPTRARPRSGARRATRKGSGLPSVSLHLNPDVTRSLVAVVLLVLGAVILIGKVLKGGALTDWILHVIAPWFGTGAWLLPFVLLAAGVYVERAKGPAGGWVRTLVGTAIAFSALLGIVSVSVQAGFGIAQGRSGGVIGRALADLLVKPVTIPGAFVVLIGLLLAGLVVALDRPLREILSPVGRGAGAIGTALSTPTAGRSPDPTAKAGRAAAVPAAVEPGGSVRGGRGARDQVRPEIPSPLGSGATLPSSVFGGGVAGSASGGTATTSAVATSGGVATSGAVATPIVGEQLGLPRVIGIEADGRPGGNGSRAVGAGPRPWDDVTDGSDSPPTRERREYRLPPLELLEDVTARAADRGMDHERNAAIIVGKLASFNIPSRVTRWNAGPVVTQYEVEPDASVKVSRIDALSDDLAMALAARTIRIEAPIPGKSVVGIEIPNNDFNVVAIRRILEDNEVRAMPSRLAFALGRDVAGHPRATDLAKMPHLLIAGATGSGKSVMVNALIASLLMRATPDEVRLILVDPKRVELADYNAIPHLMVPVITEADRARSALKWLVGEMENRYRRFAGAAARNITAFNETRVNPDDRLPYIVVVVDELADLMMRDGRQVEDPIVRLAQKARATGIHLVLATQRPSVNVVTGLIKANFPSRIAFAMASQIDSRTILDAPGAEDLIGRGDMLFQPSDQPRPIRLQGVFVSDREVRALTDHWRAEAEPRYDLAILEDEDESTGSVEDIQDADADRLLSDAVHVVQEYDRASASLLQRRLKIGYARAARIVDQLEARGYIGAFDGSNARQVLRRDAGSPARPAGGEDEDD